MTTTSTLNQEYVVVNPQVDGQLAKLDMARQLLEAAKTIDEIKYVRDIAESARLYAREHKLGLEAQNHGAEIAIRAARKIGKIIPQEFPKGGDRKSNFTRSSLNDAGISYYQSVKWQKLAALSDEVFEGYIEGFSDRLKELTTVGVLRLYKDREREKKREENRDLIENTPPLTYVPDVGTYQTIVIDPPWSKEDEGDHDQLGRAQPTYGTMTIDEIEALPVFDLASEHAHIYLWITNRSLPKGFRLLDAWDFRYITTLTWIKPYFGMGNYFRGSTEHILFGVRGSLPLLRNDAPTHFEAPRSKRHSGKPDMFFELVESCSPGPWLEIFARSERNGWVSWGAEV